MCYFSFSKFRVGYLISDMGGKGYEYKKNHTFILIIAIVGLASFTAINGMEVGKVKLEKQRIQLI